MPEEKVMICVKWNQKEKYKQAHAVWLLFRVRLFLSLGVFYKMNSLPIWTYMQSVKAYTETVHRVNIHFLADQEQTGVETPREVVVVHPWEYGQRRFLGADASSVSGEPPPRL